jgi:hypothetical protein
MEKQKASIDYTCIPDNTDLIASESQWELSQIACMCRVLRHEATVNVRYLVELSNGERRWISEGDGGNNG